MNENVENSSENIDLEKEMDVVELCPHCDTENAVKANPGQMITICKNCGKAIVLCDKCVSLHTDKDGKIEERDCSDCKFCDLANFMNYLKGFCTVEKFLENLNPPLTDMTTGLPMGISATLDDYLNDTYGDTVQWDVKYWDIYRLVKESVLDKDSSESDCREIVETIIKMNKE